MVDRQTENKILGSLYSTKEAIIVEMRKEVEIAGKVGFAIGIVMGMALATILCNVGS